MIKLSFLVATILTGCGEESKLDKNSFISGDNNFNGAVAYSIVRQQMTEINIEAADSKALADLGQAQDALFALRKLAKRNIKEKATKDLMVALAKVGIDIAPFERAIYELSNAKKLGNNNPLKSFLDQNID